VPANKNKAAAQRAADTLNQAVELDPQALAYLFNQRAVCSEELSEHPTIPVLRQDDGADWVGALGLINGALRSATGHILEALYDDDDRLFAFQVRE
jgi:hypothetical protein